MIRVSATNHLKGIASSAILNGGLVALPTATGYAPTDLCDGLVGQAWRSGQSRTLHQIATDLGSVKEVSLLAAFDVESPTPGVTAATVRVLGHASASPSATYTEIGTFDVTARRDGYLVPTAPVSARWLFWEITFVGGAEGVLDVGELWAGDLTTFTRGYLTRSDESSHETIVNDDRAVQAGDERMILDLSWGAMPDAHGQEIVTFKRAVGGARDPFVLIPDASDSGTVFHGRITDSLTSRFDYPNRTGLAWRFTESRRAFG